jgi:hypothetical protein
MIKKLFAMNKKSPGIKITGTILSGFHLISPQSWPWTVDCERTTRRLQSKKTNKAKVRLDLNSWSVVRSQSTLNAYFEDKFKWTSDICNTNIIDVYRNTFFLQFLSFPKRDCTGVHIKSKSTFSKISSHLFFWGERVGNLVVKINEKFKTLTLIVKQ